MRCKDRTKILFSKIFIRFFDDFFNIFSLTSPKSPPQPFRSPIPLTVKYSLHTRKNDITITETFPDSHTIIQSVCTFSHNCLPLTRHYTATTHTITTHHHRQPPPHTLPTPDKFRLNKKNLRTTPCRDLYFITTSVPRVGHSANACPQLSSFYATSRVVCARTSNNRQAVRAHYRRHRFFSLLEIIFATRSSAHQQTGGGSIGGKAQSQRTCPATGSASVRERTQSLPPSQQQGRLCSRKETITAHLPTQRVSPVREKAQKKPLEIIERLCSGSKGIRTPDPLLVRQML